ncbi:hypothetical protein HU200_029577 [Digitaria exilis]|uniref:Peroxidase n=1 Tax=Digitaria exilis TaxID=1010633 RepID=A0A835EUL9_9POAL|nr:hypothetical protein HU200_029577 [Digitaria exilis]
MGAGIRILAVFLAALAAAAGVAAQLREDYYAAVCPDLETIVRDAVTKKVQAQPVAVGATIRLFFHDCFVEVRSLFFYLAAGARDGGGCDASVILVSTGNNTAEKDHPSNLSLAGDGFDTVIQAKAAVDAVPACANQVSCADILALATRDVIVLVRLYLTALMIRSVINAAAAQNRAFPFRSGNQFLQSACAGGPSYTVELGRLDGLVSLSTNVDGKLPPPSFNLDQLLSVFVPNNLTLADLIALSGHCGTFANRIQPASVDPTMNASYAADLLAACPAGVDRNVALELDPVTPDAFDNQYFVNLVNGRGLLASDQVLYSDARSQPTVVAWSQNADAFNAAFVDAITKLGRVGVKTDPSMGNIRRDCAFLNN